MQNYTVGLLMCEERNAYAGNYAVGLLMCEECKARVEL
jgi:hypothetical protein